MEPLNFADFISGFRNEFTHLLAIFLSFISK